MGLFFKRSIMASFNQISTLDIYCLHSKDQLFVYVAYIPKDQSGVAVYIPKINVELHSLENYEKCFLSLPFFKLLF